MLTRSRSDHPHLGPAFHTSLRVALLGRPGARDLLHIRFFETHRGAGSPGSSRVDARSSAPPKVSPSLHRTWCFLSTIPSSRNIPIPDTQEIPFPEKHASARFPNNTIHSQMRCTYLSLCKEVGHVFHRVGSNDRHILIASLHYSLSLVVGDKMRLRLTSGKDPIIDIGSYSRSDLHTYRPVSSARAPWLSSALHRGAHRASEYLGTEAPET
jgi:hypothetical protein